jgi:spartin
MDHETTLLYSIPNVKAYHIQDGEEQDLNPSGPQTLSLLLIPTSSPYPGGSSKKTEEDLYLHLNLPPELDLPLPATTQIYHQRPNNYLIPQWDPSGEAASFTRLEFPPLGRGIKQEDFDTFETILAQFTAFMERAQAPRSKTGVPTYNPADYKPGEGYALGTGSGNHGQVVLINEENGSIVGEVAEGATIIEDPALTPGLKGNPPEPLFV